MDIFLIILGFGLGALIIAALVFGTLMLYLRGMRKDRKDRKYPLNISYILRAFFAVLVIHIACVVGAYLIAIQNSTPENPVENPNFVSSLVIGFKEIYSQLGGLTFEGQSLIFEGAHIGIQVCSLFYFGSILYLALLDAALIVLGVSYNFYSRVRLTRYRLFNCSFISKLFHKKYDHIYIFTFASEESLTLARTIDDGQQKDDIVEAIKQRLIVEKEKINRKYTILLRKNADEFAELNNAMDRFRYSVDDNKKEKKKELKKCIKDNRFERNYLVVQKQKELAAAKAKYSLEKKEANERAKLKNSLIIFASDEIGPYDKDNPIHHRIAERNYLYISLNKIRTKKSIIQRLFGKNKTGRNLIAFLEMHQISVISFAMDEKGNAIESKNSDLIFDDIECALKSLSVEFNKNGLNREDIEKCCYDQLSQMLAMNYYSLSGSEINFEFYEEKLLGCYRNAFNLKNKTSIGLNEMPPIINLNVLSEAIMSAEDMVIQRHNAISQSKDLIFGDSKETKEWVNYKEKGTKALVIGFGLNGQKALDHFYADCLGGYMDDKYEFVPNKFSAEVIDRTMDNVISSYVASHPSFAFIPGKYKDDISTNDGCYKQLKKFYSGYENFDEINALMAFPQIFYRKGNYNSDRFLKVIDAICRKEYDAVIVALGDDDKTIECANNILKSLRRSLSISSSSDKKSVEVLINIRDKDNNQRLMWTKKDEDAFDDVTVIRFGNTESIYSQNRLVDYSSAANINKTYLEIQGEDVFSNFKSEHIKWQCHYLQECGLYGKKINSASSEFGTIYKAYLEKSNRMKMIKDDYAAFEKERNTAYQKKDYETENIDNEQHKKTIIFFKETVANKTFYDNLPKKLLIKDKTINATLANHERIIAFNEGAKEYLKPGSLGYYWRYLIQLEHHRWSRHIMIYGRAFTSSYKSVSNKKLDGDSDYWKNRVLLHNCLIPYSSFTDYHEQLEAKYLPYKAEDYDYGVIIASLNMNVGGQYYF